MKREREKQQRKEAAMMGQAQPRGKLPRKTNQKNFTNYRRWNDRNQVFYCVQFDLNFPAHLRKVRYYRGPGP